MLSSTAGMQALFKVSSCRDKTNSTVPHNGKIRKYFIAAEELIWDYGPTEINQYTGNKLADDR